MGATDTRQGLGASKEEIVDMQVFSQIQRHPVAPASVVIV